MRTFRRIGLESLSIGLLLLCSALKMEGEGLGHQTNELSTTPGLPVITQQPTSSTGVGVGQTAMLSVVAIGAEPLTYQWKFFGTNLSGATSATLMLAKVGNSDNGIYSVLVTNRLGTTVSSNAFLFVFQPFHLEPVFPVPGTSPPGSTGGLKWFEAILHGEPRREYHPPCAKSNCYPRGGFVVPKGVLPDGLVVFGFQFVAVF
jgi:Immunoglobulin domain